MGSVSWKELAQVLRHKFSISTGALRAISESDLSYMAEKLKVFSDDERKLITFHRFAKVSTISIFSFKVASLFYFVLRNFSQFVTKYILLCQHIILYI